MRNYTPDPRLYELVTILSPDVSEDDLPGQVDSIAGYVTTAGGTVDEILRDSPWGRRRLAYTIRHAGRDLRDGYYTVFHVTMDPGGVREIERDLKLNDQVIRFMITHYTPKPVQPGQPVEGAGPGSTATDVPTSPPAEDAPALEAPGTEATEAATVPSQPEASETSADALVESAAAAPESPDVETAADVAIEPPAESAEEVPSDDAPEATDTIAQMDAEADVEAAPETVSAPESASPATDTAESTDTPVEADAAPAEPTAPAKDTEEA